jgi:hypothetical protein
MMAILLFMVFLAFAALTIDGAMTYQVRRNLQNVADAATLAACRVIADNDTALNSNVTTAAYMAAKNTVAAHFGSWAEFVGTNPPATNAGSGVGLVKGIEISSAEVRVAVQRRVPTVLTQFFNRGDSTMLAQARCSATAGGGLKPIAVRRYDAKYGTNVDYVARIGAPQYPTDTVTVAWSPARYSANVCSPTTSYCVPVPCGNPGAPLCPGGTDYTASDTNPGPIVEILGQGALPNTGVTSYDNFADLDVRNIAAGSSYIEYYNGADGSLNTDKALERKWIYNGYPGPYFLPGEQLGILNGAGAAFEAAAMRDAGYKVGDAVTVIVYDGNVWDTPDFNVSLTPNSGSIDGVATTVRPEDPATAVSYTVNIAKNGSANWSTPLSFDLYFKLSETNGSSGIQMRINSTDLALTPANGYRYTTPPVNQGTGWAGTLYVWTTDSITDTPSYLSGLNVVAINSQGRDKGTSSHFGFGSYNAPNFTVRSGKSPSSSNGILTIRQGESAKPVELLTTYGWGANGGTSGGPNCPNATVTPDVYLTDGATMQTWTNFFPAGDRTGVTIDVDTTPASKRENYLSNSYTLHANPLAPQGSYILRFSVTCSGVTHSVDVPLTIAPPPSGSSTPTNFVVFQGYAIFRIINMDANTVWGRAISPLYQSLSQITYGLQPRLVPWN